jgi:hypothetical protein
MLDRIRQSSFLILLLAMALLAACSSQESQGCRAGHPVRWCPFDGDHTSSSIDRGQNTTWLPHEVWNFFSQF